MQSKFIRTLIIINGLIIPVFALILIYKLAEDYFRSYDFRPESILVGEKLDGAVAKNEALQGLYYDSPMSIYNSTNMYMPLSVISYEEAKALDKLEEEESSINYNQFGIAPDKYAPRDMAYNSNENIFNVLFMDENYKVIGKLLDKKAAISNIEIPGSYSEDKKVDTTVKHISYYIAFEDSNGDGLLDGKDNHDLYISDLSGKHLTQVTNNIAIQNFYFQNDHSQIMITYKERTDKAKEEHLRRKFALYDIATKKLTPLADVHTSLDTIEKQLTHK